MTEDVQEIIVNGNKYFAVELYNRTWDLLEKKDRTPEETDEMLHAAHASAYHWSQLEGHVDQERWQHSFAISHNQIAYVYIALGNVERALYHANRCMEYFDKYGLGGFPNAYGYDCLAKAYDLAGDTEKRDENTRLAIEAGKKIEDEEFRKSFFDELSKVAGYAEVKGQVGQ